MKKLLKKLKSKSDHKITLLLLFMSVFCFSLSVFRFWISGEMVYLFLNWNLFLAVVPWIAASVLSFSDLRKNKIIQIFLLTTWLLFFPNSPYILTDLFHLHFRAPIPIWFDLILILSFAWTGLAFGFISLMKIESLLKAHIKPIIIQPLIIVMLFISGFGVYVGRYLRWNSWDVIDNSSSIFFDIAHRLANPLSHPTTWGITILMGVLLNMMYWTIKLFRTENHAQ